MSAQSELPIVWEGNLDDDCTAHWSGLVLRAEEMDRLYWWWAVYEDGGGEPVRDSHEPGAVAASANQARSAAESAAREWLARKEVK